MVSQGTEKSCRINETIITYWYTFIMINYKLFRYWNDFVLVQTDTGMYTRM
jgi:hypothetical protein